MRNLSNLRTHFNKNVQSFCFNNQPAIFSIFCILNISLLLCFLDLATVTIIFFWLGFLYTALFFIIQVKVPLLECFFPVIIITHVGYLPFKHINGLIFFCMFLAWVFLVFKFLLKNTSVQSNLEIFFHEYKKAKEILINHRFKEFLYFRVFSVLITVVFLIFFLFKKFYKIESLIVFFENLDTDKQTVVFPFILAISFSVIILSIIDWLIIDFFNYRIFLAPMRYLMKCETLFRVAGGIVSVLAIGGAVDHFAMSPEKFYSLPGCSQYRIYRMKFDWDIPLSLTLAAQYSDLTNGCTPPLLENGLVDRPKTLERIKLLKEFKENQSILMAVFLKSDQVTFEEIIKFNHTQVLVYQRFYKRVDSGLLRSDKPKIPRTEFYYDEEGDLKSRVVIDEED